MRLKTERSECRTFDGQQLTSTNNQNQSTMFNMTYKDNDAARVWDYIINNGIATEDELQLVTDINGYSVDTLNDVLYARTGYHSIEQAAE
jgi:hypothetical protein